MNIARPEVLRILFQGRIQILKNQVTKRGQWGLVIILILSILFIGFQFSVGILSGAALKEFREIDGSALWGFLLFFTSVIALLLPLRSPQSYYPKDIQFRFLHVSTTEWYLADWIDRLTQGTVLFPLSLLAGFAITWFPLSMLPIALPVLFLWILVLPILSRLVVAGLSKFTNTPANRRLLMIVFLVVYFGFLFFIGDDQHSADRMEGLTALWFSRPVVNVLLNPDSMGLFILVTGFGGFILLDRLAFNALSTREESLSPPSSDKTKEKKKTPISNPWLAVLFRHPSFGLLLVSLPVITFILNQDLFRMDAVQRVLITDQRMILLIFTAGFWSYGLGMMDAFGIHHLTAKPAMRQLVRPIKNLQFLTVGFYLILVFGWDWFELTGTVFSSFLLVKVLTGAAIAILVADLLLILNPWLYPRFPTRMQKTGRSAGTMIFNLLLIAGIFLLIIIQEVIISMGPGHSAEWILATFSGGYLLASFLGIPAVLPSWWIKQSELFISHFSEGS